MIRHVVIWELLATEGPEKAAAKITITEALESLVPKIFQIRALSVNPDVGVEGNWDISLTADFDSIDDLLAYKRHPEHVIVGGVIRSLTIRRAAIDFEV
ncbi:MAG: Dabb family protein [Salinibacterium sp.]|nr:MAG: Dabb family protein [Salinibacterium sp.]